MNYYCYFCSARCVKISIQPTNWWRCITCDVEFKDGEDAMEAMSFAIRKPGVIYILELYFNQNKTKVKVLYSDTGLGLFNGNDMYKPPILEIPRLVQGVTPQNAAEKLNTLLTFS